MQEGIYNWCPMKLNDSKRSLVLYSDAASEAPEDEEILQVKARLGFYRVRGREPYLSCWSGACGTFQLQLLQWLKVSFVISPLAEDHCCNTSQKPARTVLLKAVSVNVAIRGLGSRAAEVGNKGKRKRDNCQRLFSFFLRKYTNKISVGFLKWMKMVSSGKGERKRVVRKASARKRHSNWSLTVEKEQVTRRCGRFSDYICMGAVVSLAYAQRRKNKGDVWDEGTARESAGFALMFGQMGRHRECGTQGSSYLTATVRSWQQPSLHLAGLQCRPAGVFGVVALNSVLKKSFGHHVKVQVQEAWDKAVILLMDTALRRKALRVSLKTLCPLQPPQTLTASEWVGSCFILFLLDHSEYHGKPFLGLLASWNHCRLRGLLFVDFQLKSKNGRSYLNHLSCRCL